MGSPFRGRWALLLTGAFLHDIGKTVVLKERAYREEGRLLGHIIPGISLLDGKIQKVGHFPKELYSALRHLILSHHGGRDGSGVYPKTKEAIILRHADSLDVSMNRT